MKKKKRTRETKNTITARVENTPVLDKSNICAKVDGNVDTIPTKIINEIPFPMPDAVIFSPNHISITVPPTKLTTVVYKKISDVEINIFS